MASLAEKVVKDFGYDVVLAASPDPDFCGSDSVDCSGTTPTATMNWEAQPIPISSSPLGGLCDSMIVVSYYYILTVPGVSTFNTGTNNSYTVSSGLNNNTTYSWSVEAYWQGSSRNSWSSTYCGYTNQPYGSFTTLNCAPPPTHKVCSGNSCVSVAGAGVDECSSNAQCAPPLPPTVTLTTWSTFTLPEPVSLYWSSTNADSCVASGDWSGSKTIQGEEHFSKPRGDYIFTLTCTGPGGSAFDTKNVKVIQVPQCSFTANPTSIILPASSTLSWSCEYADACSIDQGIGSVNPVSGTKSVRPSQTTTYTLTCSSLDGSRSYPATVNVGFEPTRREVPPR